MNSFALLQDDVEDASDLSVNTTPYSPDEHKPETTPVSVAEESRPTRASELKKEHTPSTEPSAQAPAASPNGDNAEAKPEDAPPPPPKEKEMTFEEYQAKKAQLSSGLASLNTRKGRRADNGDFSKMSVLKKTDVAEPENDSSIMSTVGVKEQLGSKTLKDSTHTAVAKNAEIQQFFKREPRSGSNRGRDRRYNGDSRSGRNGPARHEGGNRPQRDYRRDQRNGYTPRGDDASGRSFSSPHVAMAPNVDDTAAFPSL